MDILSDVLSLEDVELSIRNQKWLIKLARGDIVHIRLTVKKPRMI